MKPPITYSGKGKLDVHSKNLFACARPRILRGFNACHSTFFSKYSWNTILFWKIGKGSIQKAQRLLILRCRGFLMTSYLIAATFSTPRVRWTKKRIDWIESNLFKPSQCRQCESLFFKNTAWIGNLIESMLLRLGLSAGLGLGHGSFLCSDQLGQLLVPAHAVLLATVRQTVGNPVPTFGPEAGRISLQGLLKKLLFVGCPRSLRGWRN